MEENHTSYIDYLEFLNSGGTVIEYNNPEEDLETMISELRLRYSEKISYRSCYNKKERGIKSGIYDYFRKDSK